MPVKGDYPYSGSLFLELARENIIDGNKLWRSELWLGVMGPSALAWEEQLEIHRVLKSQIPKGWPYQLPDYPIVNYNIYYEQGLAGANSIVKFKGVGYLQLGSLLNAVTGGFSVVISNQRKNFFPERSYFANADRNWRKWKLSLELTPQLLFTATNAILEGGLFQQKNYYHIPQASSIALYSHHNSRLVFR